MSSKIMAFTTEYGTHPSEKGPGSISDSSLHKSDLNLDPALVSKTVRKLDWSILPLVTMFYLLSFLDRANIGNARVAGLQKGLHLTDRQYQICVTVTYIPYILAELPSNLVLRKIGPNIALPAILTIWGVIVMTQGFVTSFEGLLAARFFLGLVEGPMFPGIALYLSGFYTRAELSVRIAFFFSAASLSGAFSGLLAAAITKMHNVGGRPSWAWIFILEGLFTVVFGIISFFLTPATPRDSLFLTDAEKDLIMQRLEKDRPTISSLDSFNLKQVLVAFKSPHVIFMFIAFFLGGVNFFGLALFSPTIINQLGFSPNRTQLLSVGPFGAAFCMTLFIAWASDRYKTRAIPLCFVCIVGAAGYAMYLSTDNKHISYGSLFLMSPGICGTVPVIAAWIANNSEPHYTRATAIAICFMATSLGGIVSTWNYPTNEAPRYKKTTALNLTCMLVIFVMSIVNFVYLRYQNKKKVENRDQILAPYITEQDPDGGATAWIELGDRHPDFQYVL